jgi:hypothetical protein
MDSIDADRFWSKVDRNGGPDACWHMGEQLADEALEEHRQGKRQAR